MLLKPHWNVHDVCDYLDCKKTKAYEVMKICKKEHNGMIRFNSSCVTRDSVLTYLKTSIERELYINEELQKRKV